MKPVKTNVSLPEQELETLAFWKKQGIIKKGLEANKGQAPFVFYDGPPFATGLPHYGHILPGTLKDIVPRYWVMKGKYVQRRWGWDCHGLPVEFEMEKELDLKGLADIENFGIAKFNEACREIVLRYTKEWEKTISRTGRWVDFENGYRTMDPSFMESVWWVFKQLWDKGLIYEGYRVMPYSWRISTPLSNFEANLNYKSVQDPAITVRLKSTKHNRYFLVWTTTPWTLPSNLAVAVNGEVPYVEIEDAKDGSHYVIAEARVAQYFPDASTYKVLSQFKGSTLEGETYEPLFPYFKDHKGAFNILIGHHVTTEDGTGLVHMAPAFGEDDMVVCQKYKIEPVNPVDASGNFTKEVPDYQGQNVKEADKQIIKDLKTQGSLFHHGTIVHNYPFCWRSDTPLIYRAISTWFVKLDPVKEQLVKSNEKTHWVPETIRDGRFGNWLKDARDWNISRNRFWGTPLPIWRCEETNEMLCVGSIAELEKLSGKKVKDLHKHFVDDITFPSPKTGKLMKRIPEVLDCWFESGSMPYGQAHYPFENKESFEKAFPADFIAEGLDQTRGWFYTLSVLGNILFGKAPFKNVIVNGMVLAEDGKKMSKRHKNYPEPTEILDKYGADALRAYLTTSPASRAEELRFSEKGLQETVRAVLLPLWNAYSFFVTYALADGWKPEQFNPKHLDNLENELDRWVLSRLQTLIQEVEAKMAIYHLYEVIPIVLGFIDELTNWYIRLNRRRFWKEDKGKDKDAAYSTLYYILTTFTKVLAPILPFITEEIHQNLKLASEPESIHLCKFPELKTAWRDTELEAQMTLVSTVVFMGRSLRTAQKIKTRQPLKKLTVVTKNPHLEKTIRNFKDLIANELNIKEVAYDTDESKYVTFAAKANAKVLGPRLGQKMKAVLQAVAELSSEQIQELEAKKSISLMGEQIFFEEVNVVRTPKTSGASQSGSGITLVLDTDLDESLIREGQAREMVNRLQKLRKDAGLEVTDRIKVKYQCPDTLKSALEKHRDYIQSETLATEFGPSTENLTWTANQDIDDLAVKIYLEKC